MLTHLMPDDLPENPLERAKMLETICIDAATYGTNDGAVYELLRRDFVADLKLRPLLPEFIRTCRDASQMRTNAQAVGDYKARRAYIHDGFRPLFEHLEGVNRAPADAGVSDALQSFDRDGVHAVWEKAMGRRADDPDGAITSARTLLETVCKRILDEMGVKYPDGADLPALYGMVAKGLKVAPSQQTEDTFRAMLGGCQSVVERIGAIRNKHGDAHGKGAGGAKPDARHAELAVNLAGSMATFLVQTWQATKSGA